MTEPPRRRRLLPRLIDVGVALAAYALSRWIWQRGETGVFDHLLEELATFAAAYALLQLVRRSLAASRRA